LYDCNDYGCTRCDADPPSLKCVRSVSSAVRKSDVRLVCHVTSAHPVTDAQITWDVRHHLRPTARPGLPPGVQFDGDGEYLAYLRQVFTYFKIGRSVIQRDR